MRTTSNRALARHIGVSETAVRRAEKAGRIRREADGSWDLARVQAAWSSNTDRSQQRREHRAVKPVPEAAVGAVRETLREHGESVVAGAMTFMQARTADARADPERRLHGPLWWTRGADPTVSESAPSLRLSCPQPHPVVNTATICR